MSLEVVLILFFGMILVGVPISFAMISISGAYFLLGPIPSFVDLLPQKIFEGIDFIVLTAIPFFLLAGELMSRSGMAERLMHFSNLVIGRVRGGFAYVNVLASLLFSGLTGVAVGDIAALGKVEVIALEKAGYPRPFAAAVTVASSLVGPIIPPSGIIILYCAIMNVSVGAMFLAALIPGVMMALADMLVIGAQAKKRNFPKSDVKRSLPEFVTGTKDATLALLMPVVLIGGIVGGIMTPTEAAGVAVIYALPVGFWIYKGLTWNTFVSVLRESAVTIGVVMVMVFIVLIVSRFLVFEAIPGMAKSLVFSISDNPIVILLMVNLVMILIGLLMDDVSGILLSAPLLLPVVTSVGMDPIHFAAVLGVNLGMGNITPPTAPLLYLGCRVTDVPVNKVIGPTIVMIVFAWLPTLLLTTFLPQIALWLPNLVFGA